MRERAAETWLLLTEAIIAGARRDTGRVAEVLRRAVRVGISGAAVIGCRAGAVRLATLRGIGRPMQCLKRNLIEGEQA
jgi:hypothetical protein